MVSLGHLSEELGEEVSASEDGRADFGKGVISGSWGGMSGQEEGGEQG